MTAPSNPSSKCLLLLSLGAGALAGCNDHEDTKIEAARYALGSVVIDADGNRTTYVQTVKSLDDGPFDNQRAIELPGNGVLMAGGKSFFVGSAESPTWVRYSSDPDGNIVESGRLNLLNVGASYIDFGNAYVDDETAVSVFTDPAVAVVWNPSTMKIRGQIELSSLVRDGYELEVWTTIAHDGLVYVPGRWADWEGGRIYPGVSLTILDPKTMTLVAIAEDDRCASGGRIVFAPDGYGYVMGDGRTYSIQMFANAAGEPAPENCLLRIAPGATKFDPSFFYTIKSLTGGLEAIGELESPQQGSGVGFAKLFYPDELPAGVEPVDFDFWSVPAHKQWRFELADPPSAEEVQGVPFAAIGFGGSALDGRLYSGESPDGRRSDVYEIDADGASARLRFQMDGYFSGLYDLSR